MRGKVQLRNGKQTSRGITPAYAGKRWTVAGTVAARWDHPRVCGEKSGKSRPGKAGGGSPPRMRGKGVGAAHFAGYHGITPAYAGKRQEHCGCPDVSGDHPRVCGEKIFWRCASSAFAGSPPRMRGKDKQLQVFLADLGITPAYAGKSVYFDVINACWEDHPRVCGEKFASPCPWRVV